MSQPRRSPLRRLHALPLAAFAGAVACLLAFASPALAAPFVFIDPGHGGIYNHTHYGRLTEKAANLLVSQELRRQLQADGIGVGMTRKTDTAVNTADIPTWRYNSSTGLWAYAKDGRRFGDPPPDDLQARCNAANSAGADIFVSVHNNASGGSSTANGTETYAAPADRLGISLSKYVQSAVVKRTGLRNRGAFRTSFYVLRWTNMPAILVEGAFMTNPSNGRFLASPTGRAKLARGIADGIEAWFATNPFKPFMPRFRGSTPSDVAAAASIKGWPTGAGTVLLASSSQPTGALGCAALSRSLHAPLLLADASGLPTSTAAELARLHPASILVLADTTALSPDLVAAACSAAGIAPAAARRVSGSDVYESAALLAAESGIPTSGPGIGRVVIASDASLAAVLSASAYSAANGAPLLLATSGGTTLPAPTAAFLAAHSDEITKAVVFGSATDVSQWALAGLPNVMRVYYADRFRANAEMLRRCLPSGPLAPFVVSPASPAEGLVAMAAAANTRGGAVLLNEGRRMSPYTREWITNVRTRDPKFTVVGGFETQPAIVEYMLDKAAY